MSIASRNPASGELIREFPALSGPDLESKLEAAARASKGWRRTPFSERASKMRSLASLLERDQAILGQLMTLEMGKLARAAGEEALKCAKVCHFYAENAERFLQPESVELDGGAAGSVRFEPLGVIMAVMPWNFPFWQVFRFLAPALMAGNVGLLKHASNVPQCALAIESLVREAGFPPGVFQTLLIGSEKVEAVIRDRRVQAVTLTGSVGAGRKVAAVAGEALKKTVLELGGSDAFVVTAHADIPVAAAAAARARTINSGQSCIAAKRFIAVASVADAFEREFQRELEALRVGDPADPASAVGPLATAEILADLEKQVRETLRQGARLVTGGKRVGTVGNYYAPTLLADIPRGSPADVEELFGPVASFFRARNLDEAIEIANRTEFGLGASGWSNDPAEQARLVSELEAGCVFINGTVASDPRLPFGGIKSSGYGRELGAFGIREFMNIKAVSHTRTAGTPVASGGVGAGGTAAGVKA